MKFGRRLFGGPLSNLLGRRCANYVTVAWDTQKEQLKYDKIGGKYSVTVVPGEGSSASAMKAMQAVLDCTGAPLLIETMKDVKQEDDFKNMLISIKRNKLAITGDIPRETSEWLESMVHMTRNMVMRRKLDLHAFITEIKSFEGLQPLMRIHKKIDVTVIRQNTEGDYMLLEHSPQKNVVELLRVITRNNTKRLTETAFAYAVKKKRRVVQCLHRAESLPISEGTFINAFNEVANAQCDMDYKVISLKEAFTDYLIDPKHLDVVVTNGLDGLMLTNMLMGMLGSPHLVAGMNIGGNNLVMEPASRQRGIGYYPNPTAHFLCGAGLLDFLGKEEDANYIRKAIEEVYLDGVLTEDLGGKATLSEFTIAVVKKIRKKRPLKLCSLDKSPKPNPKHKKPEPFKPSQNK